MKNQMIAAVSLLALSACGGGGGSNFGAADYAAFASDPNLGALTPDATVDALNSSPTYNGYSSLIVGSGLDAVFYYGTLNVSANFSSNTLTGSTGNFTRYYSAIASPSNGQSASGSIALNGTITPLDNTTFDGSIGGTAIGSIDGTTVNGDLTGRFTGLNAEGVSVTIDDSVNDVFGGGLALQ
ncbi:MAG: hypothetical protein GKR98_08675 [Boseongicola sp.]|nr:MAG: hypothetical protein GKR98_08675 [Boseongicola sp.]